MKSYLVFLLLISLWFRGNGDVSISVQLGNRGLPLHCADNYAILYEEPLYGGRYIVLDADIDGVDLADWHFQVRSIRVVGAMEVLLFDQSGYWGHRLAISWDVPNLAHVWMYDASGMKFRWQDRVLSVCLEWTTTTSPSAAICWTAARPLPCYYLRTPIRYSRLHHLRPQIWHPRSVPPYHHSSYHPSERPPPRVTPPHPVSPPAVRPPRPPMSPPVFRPPPPPPATRPLPPVVHPSPKPAPPQMTPPGRPPSFRPPPASRPPSNKPPVVHPDADPRKVPPTARPPSAPPSGQVRPPSAPGQGEGAQPGYQPGGRPPGSPPSSPPPSRKPTTDRPSPTHRPPK